MIELDFFKSKLIGFLNEYAPDRINETEWIEELSDAAYDEMNRFIQSGAQRYTAQNMALTQMLSCVPDSLYLRLDRLYEENYNPYANIDELPLFKGKERCETILSLLKVWPKESAELSDTECLEIIQKLVKEGNHGI